MFSIGLSSNANLLARRYTKIAESITPEMVAAEKAAMQDIKNRAIRLSSYTGYRIGVDPGYPYSANPKKGNPPMPGPPYQVNVQSGLLKGSWRTQVRVTVNGMTSTIYNTAPYSRFFSGRATVRMVGRPILQRVLKQERDARFRRLKAAKQKALGAGGTVRRLRG